MLKIRDKIWRSYIIVSLLVAVLVGGINLWYSWEVTNKEAHQHLIDVTQKYANKIDGAFNNLEIHASTLEGLVRSTYDIQKHYGDSTSMVEYKNRVAPIVDSLCHSVQPLSMWIIFHQDVAPGPHGISFWKRQGEEGYMREEEYNPTDYDLSSPEMKWWVQAMKNGEYWTEPYFWANWELELITYARKVTIDGKPVAVLGSDFDFKSFREDIQNEIVYESGYLYLVNEELELIIHPEYQGENLKDILSGRDFDRVLELVKNEKRGTFEYLLDGEKKISGFTRMDNGWLVGAAPPREEMYSGFYSTRNATLLIILFTLLVTWFIAYFFGRSLTSPLNRLVQLFRKGAGGDLSVRSDLETKDEISELGYYFNSFMESMEQMITSLNQSQMQLDIARLKAEESERLKTRFLASISHEIRTPLNAILGFTNILTGQKMDEKSREKYLEFIHENSESLIQLIDGLIDLSKTEVNKMQLKETPFDVNELMQKLRDQYQQNKEGLLFKVQNKIRSKDANIFADKEKIEQILHLLLDNAFKFTETGSVTCGCKLVDQKLIFYVADTGIGIKPEYSKVIFNKFRKGEEFRSKIFRGTGMGLALASALVDLMQGKIWFESTPGEGSVFYFSIQHVQATKMRTKVNSERENAN